MSAFSDEFAEVDLELLDAFGEIITYIPAGGQPVGIVGIFTERVDEPVNPGFVSQLFIRSGTLNVDPQRGDRIVLEGAAYEVGDVVDTGAGSRTMQLKRV